MAELKDFDPATGLPFGTGALNGEFPEGMSYANVNNAAREMQAILGRDYRNRNGSIPSTGSGAGLSVTPLLKSGDSYTTPAEGDRISFRLHVALEANAMLTVGGATAAPLRDQNGIAVEANAAPMGAVLDCVYRAAGWNCQGLGNPATGQGFNPNAIAGVQNTAVVSVRNDRDNSTQQKVWRGSATQHAAVTKIPNTIYVEESTALLRPGTFDPNTIGGVENNNVRAVQEARASGSVSVWLGSDAQFTALTTYVLNRLYIVPE